MSAAVQSQHEYALPHAEDVHPGIEQMPGSVGVAVGSFRQKLAEPGQSLPALQLLPRPLSPALAASLEGAASDAGVVASAADSLPPSVGVASSRHASYCGAYVKPGRHLFASVTHAASDESAARAPSRASGDVIAAAMSIGRHPSATVEPREKPCTFEEKGEDDVRKAIGPAAGRSTIELHPSRLGAVL
jgi:hypothetical protein